MKSNRLARRVKVSADGVEAGSDQAQRRLEEFDQFADEERIYFRAQSDSPA